MFAQGHLVGSGNPGSQADRRLSDGKFLDYVLTAAENWWKVLDPSNEKKRGYS